MNDRVGPMDVFSKLKELKGEALDTTAAQPKLPQVVELLMQYMHLINARDDMKKAMEDPILSNSKCIAVMQSQSKLALPNGQRAVVLMYPRDGLQAVNSSLLQVLDAFSKLSEEDIRQYVGDLGAFARAAQELRDDIERELGGEEQ